MQHYKSLEDICNWLTLNRFAVNSSLLLLHICHCTTLFVQDVPILKLPWEGHLVEFTTQIDHYNKSRQPA